MDFLNIEIPASEGASLPQNSCSELVQHFAPSPSDNFTGPFWQTLLDTPPIQAGGRSALPSLPPPGTSTDCPQHAVVDNSMGSWNAHCEGTNGAESWLTGYVSSFAAVPETPPPVPPPSSVTTFPANWIKIPQRNYNQGSKQLDFKRSGPIYFGTKKYPGINLGDALRKNIADDLGCRDAPVLQVISGVVSCRLLFPGYPDNGSSCQIHMLDWTKTRKPISHSKLAHEVARKLDRYLTNMTRVIPDRTVDGCWRIGQGFMHIDNMFLVGLISVSRGSFQPEIWVAAPSAPPVHTY